jgi:hypothetical protein
MTDSHRRLVADNMTKTVKAYLDNVAQMNFPIPFIDNEIPLLYCSFHPVQADPKLL